MKKSLDEKTERERVVDIDKDIQRNPDRKRRKRTRPPVGQQARDGETGDGVGETHAGSTETESARSEKRRIERVEREMV